MSQGAMRTPFVKRFSKLPVKGLFPFLKPEALLATLKQAGPGAADIDSGDRKCRLAATF